MNRLAIWCRYELMPMMLYPAVAIVLLFGLFDVAMAAQTIGTVADNVIGTFESVTKMITAAAYITGLGFAVGAVMKFKQHKDNPTQIPIGTPIALLFIAAALIFLPTIFGISGATLFGSDAQVGGPKGVIFLGT